MIALRKAAAISWNDEYRYTLMREIEGPTPPTRSETVAFVLNNPSKAGAELEDPTSRRGIGFMTDWGKRRLWFGNTNPFRSTDPKGVRFPPERVLLENDEYLRTMARESGIVVAAWGASANPVLAQRALDVLRSVGDVWCLGVTLSNQPRHPLYLPKDTKLTLFHRASPTPDAPTKP